MNFVRIDVYVLMLSLYHTTVLEAWSHNAERLIRRQIFDTSKYDRIARPSEITVVKVGFNLLTINFLDIKSQTFSCTAWLTVEWEDRRLEWNSTDLKTVHALSNEIWYPELFVDNSLSDVTIITNDDLQYKVSHLGRVEWEIPRIFVTHCEIDITYFPFDTQTCCIEVTSWMYHTQEQILEHLGNDINVAELLTNGEWIFKASTIKYKTLMEVKNGLQISYSQQDFIIQLQRRPMHYVTSIIIPVVITTYLSVFVFILPVQSGEKASYSLTVLLALAVLMTLIQDQMPSTALHVSYLSMFLSVCLALNAICTLFTVIIVRIYHRGPEKDVPTCIHALASCMARMCCYSCAEKKYTTVKKDYPRPRIEDFDVHPGTRIEEFHVPHGVRISDIDISVWNESIKPRADLRDCRYYTRRNSDTSNKSKRNRENVIKYKIKHYYMWTEIADIFDCFLFIVMNVLNTLLLIIFISILTVDTKQ